MKIIESTSELEKIEKGCVLSIGNFDGLHIGHRQILDTAGKIAVDKNTKLAVLTFEPHPVTILYPEKAPGILTPRLLKRDLLADAGVDLRLVLKTTAHLLSLSPADFIEQFITRTIQPTVIVEGHDFNFGADRAGGIETIEQAAAQTGFDVVVVEPQKATLSTGQTIRVSSTMIRYMLESGHVADAAIALGRAYRLIGKIIPGRGKGRHLGYPTLNMKKPDQVMPAKGVYAGTVEIADTEENACAPGRKIPAVFSIGTAASYGDQNQLLIESHLLTEDAEKFKGCFLAMDFVEHIREQRKFKSEVDLAEQIKKDCREARGSLATEDKNDK